MQASQPTIQHHIQLTPLLVPPLPFPSPYISPANTIVGGTPILFPYGKYTCLSQIPPSPYLQQVLHQHHLGKFFQNILFSLTFLSDLMKWLQYGCQQKLVNDFKMILLCFSISSFIQHGVQTDSNLISDLRLLVPILITSKQQQSNVLLIMTMWQSISLLKALGCTHYHIQNIWETQAEVIRLVEKISTAHQLTATLTPSTVSMMSGDDKYFICGWIGHFGCHCYMPSVMAVRNLAILPRTAHAGFLQQECS